MDVAREVTAPPEFVADEEAVALPPVVPVVSEAPVVPAGPALATVERDRLATFLLLVSVLAAFPPPVATPEVAFPPLPPVAV